jgi:PIN domain
MSAQSKILFVDTNAFLQMRDLKDIPWNDLFPGVQTVDLMIAPRVIEELDKHKAGTNQRRRDRARAALQLIDKAPLTPDFALVLKSNPVRLRLVISTADRLNWSAYPSLDPAKPDDQLVAEALSFGNDACVFSHDTGPRIRARMMSISSYTPLPDWLLPVEKTDDQRKITKLEQDLKHALSRFPSIEAGFKEFDASDSQVKLIMPIVPQLDPATVDRLTRHVLTENPRSSVAHTRDSIILQIGGGISERQIQQYQNDYASYETQVRHYYEHLHERVMRAGSAISVDYYIINDSGVSADGLRVEFYLNGNGYLLSDRDEAIGSDTIFKLPKPPPKTACIF